MEITGNNFFSANYLLKRNFEFKSSTEIKKLIKRILEYYNNAGFAFCKVEPSVVVLDSSRKKVILKITEGERVIIHDYLFRIKGKTEKSQLRQLARLTTNQLFTLNGLKRAKKFMEMTGVFKSINTEILKKNGEYYLFFDLTEEKTDYISLSGSLSQENSYFTMLLYTLNFFGTLRQLHFSFESNIPTDTVNSKQKRIFSLEFVDPMILSPVLLKANLLIDTRDTARLTLLGAHLTAPVNDYLSMRLYSGAEMSTYFTDNTERSSTHTLLGIGFEFSYGIEKISTTHRFDFDFLLREQNRYRFIYDGEFFYFKILFRPHYCWVRTDLFGEFDFFRIGGAKSLRGYLDEEFIIKEAFWLNLEYKGFPIYPLFDLALFNDKYLYSYGIGIDAQGKLGDASLIFAWPKDGRWNDGKVHLLLKKGF